MIIWCPNLARTAVVVQNVVSEWVSIGSRCRHLVQIGSHKVNSSLNFGG